MKRDDRSVEYLDRPIAFHRMFVKVTGSVPSALFLSQVLYWQRRCPAKREGWWWKTAEDWQEETCLTLAQQKKARQVLVDLKVLEEKKKGLPNRLWFRLDEAELWKRMQSAELWQTGKEGKPLNRDKRGKFTSATVASLPQSRNTISESTTEISAKIKPKPAPGGKRRKHFGKKNVEVYENMMGVEFPRQILQLQDVDRVAAIILKSKIRSDQVRHVFAEFSTSLNKVGVCDPWALLVTLVQKAKDCELKLSQEGEENLPPWV